MLTLLKNVPLFASLSRKDLLFLEEIARQVGFPPGTVLFHEGDRGDRLYITVEGKLEVVKSFGKPDEHVLNICGAGEPIGEMSLLNSRGVRSASVRSLTEVRLIEITREDFEMLLFRRPGLACGVARGLSRRLLDSEARFLNAAVEKNRKLCLLTKLLKSTSEELIDSEGVEQGETAQESLPSAVPIRINVLGNFQVFRGETPMEDHEWKAKQPKMLLKALITRGASGVPKDVLMEDLWPEASPEFAESNFKVVLHRLRKTLDPSAQRAQPSHYLSLKANLLTLNRDLCRIDLDEFLSSCRKAKKCEQAGDLKGAIQAGISATTLYRGD
ncbi:MAG: cyclic nucleotide-binding domain-containing protein, partial [Desulfobacteraceae bacterium]|nr:cyclic nucleotide-binding domain-containing protein [Desulfobacteraceae bacterium]